MTERQEKALHPFGILLISILVALMIIGAAGCSSSKKNSKSDTEEKKTILIRDTLYKERSDTVRVTKTEIKTETKTEVKFDTIPKDCPKNKIIYKASGDIEIEGNIKEFNNVNSKWQSKYDSLMQEMELETASKIYWQDEAKKVKTEVVVKKKKSRWFLFYSLGFLSCFGIIFYLNKKFNL